jgi:hypothetical protein
MVLDTPIEKAVLDTGPLVSAITLELVKNRPPAQREAILGRSRLQPYLRETRKHEAFLQFFQSIRVVLTTSHVVAEIHGLRFLDGEVQKNFWECAITLLGEKQFSEEHMRLFELDSLGHIETISRIGPTDVALTELARKNGYVLLTEDRRTLAPWAWDQGVRCLLVQDFL